MRSKWKPYGFFSSSHSIFLSYNQMIFLKHRLIVSVSKRYPSVPTQPCSEETQHLAVPRVICGHLSGWFLVPRARLYMLTLFLLHAFAHATPSYWKTLAPTFLPCKYLPSSSVFSSSFRSFLCAFYGVLIPTPQENFSPLKLIVLVLVCLPCWLRLLEGKD